MPKTLAVIAPQVGALSETFIRRHMESLLPKKTVVVANTNSKPYAGHWDIECPQLILNQIHQKRTLLQRAYQKVADQFAQEKDRTLLSAKKFMQRHQVDVMLCEYLDLSVRWLPLAQSLGIPFYAHAHGYDVSFRLQDEEWREKYRQLGQAKQRGLLL